MPTISLKLVVWVFFFICYCLWRDPSPTLHKIELRAPRCSFYCLVANNLLTSVLRYCITWVKKNQSLHLGQYAASEVIPRRVNCWLKTISKPPLWPSGPLRISGRAPSPLSRKSPTNLNPNLRSPIHWCSQKSKSYSLDLIAALEALAVGYIHTTYRDMKVSSKVEENLIPPSEGKTLNWCTCPSVLWPTISSSVHIL